MIYRSLSALLAALAISGCATLPPSQLPMVKTHLFRGVTLDQFNKALEVTFEASRTGGYTIGHPSPTQFTARHAWRRFVIVTLEANQETWQVTGIPNGSDVIATAEWTMATGDFVPLVDVPPPDQFQNYSLLWERVEYVLGQRPDWVTCEDFHRTRGNPSRAYTETFCGANTKEGPRPPVLVIAAK